MKKNVPMKRFACFALSVLFLCLMLAGCGSTAEPASSGIVPSSSSQVVSSVSQEVSSAAMPVSSSSKAKPEEEPEYTRTEAYQNAEPWQQAYYDVCVQHDLLDTEIELLYPDEGTPLLVTPIQISDNSSPDYLLCWSFSGYSARMFYGGQGDFFINRKTGNLVVYEGEYSESMGRTYFLWHELVGKEKVLLDRTTFCGQVYPVDAEIIISGTSGTPAQLL